jgi:ABC-type glycerol-3-phosphate transport system substrate-binding protein
MDGLPDGKWLMYKNTEAVVLGKRTPKEAADNLQDNLAQWYEPAQECLQKIP